MFLDDIMIDRHVWHFVGSESWFLIICRISSSKHQADLKQFFADQEIAMEQIHLPFDSRVIKEIQLTKSYVWFVDDPYAALLALAAILILLSIVGIMVVMFSWSR